MAFKEDEEGRGLCLREKRRSRKRSKEGGAPSRKKEEDKEVRSSYRL